MRKLKLLSLSAVMTTGLVLSTSFAFAGHYGSRSSGSYSNSNKSLFSNYSTYKMEGYNFRSHTSLNRVNHKRSFTLHRVYDKDKRSYRTLQKLKK